MNRIEESNSGEGGEDPSRFIKNLNGDSKNSAIKQVASGRVSTI
jgi:glutamate synthase (ferredoxin)